MSNEGNKELYRQIVMVFDELSSGNRPSELEHIVSRAHRLFSGGYNPTEYPTSDFGVEIVRNLAEYGNLLHQRKKIIIEGAEREVTTEQEAHRSLVLASELADRLILPNFESKTEFTNKVFNDIYNLGLAYLQGIVAAVGEEYINSEDAFDAKTTAVRIAGKGIRVLDVYHDDGLSKKLKGCVKNLTRRIKKSQPEFVRSFELVPTSQKKIYHGNLLMKHLTEEITKTDSAGEFIFKPHTIFPIAQGGNEFGLRIANAYQDKEYSPQVYPLLYSIKTRKHRYPWVSHDSMVLGKELEDKDLLVVEDWVTTGNTLRGILNELERRYPHEIKVATIKRDPEKSKARTLNSYNFYVGQWAEYNGSKTDSLQILNGKHPTVTLI